MSDDEVRWSKGAAQAAGALAVAASEVLHANDDGIKNLRRALENYDREVMALQREEDLVQQVETKLTEERSCQNCEHLGADPDGPYCGHPKVLAKHPFGLNPVKARKSYCDGPVRAERVLMWEPRKPR